jgi:hypothetical protein
MDKNHPGRQYVDPRLLALMDKAEEEESLDLNSLRKDDVIFVQTRNTIYTMKVLDPKKGRVLVNSDGEHVTQETNGTVLGTTLTGTGTMVKLNTIILGLRLCVFIEGRGELIFSPTQRVSINGCRIFPIDKNNKPS